MIIQSSANNSQNDGRFAANCDLSKSSDYAEALKWLRRAAHSGLVESVQQLERFPLTWPGMRVGVIGLTSPAGKVLACMHACPTPLIIVFTPP